MMWLGETVMTDPGDVRIEALSPELVNSDRLSRLFRIWKEIRGPQGLPSRADLSPERLGFILGQITIVDILRDPINFRYRLIGTRLEEAGRRGDQGKTLDQVEPASYRDMITKSFRQVVDFKPPLCQHVSYLQNQNLVSYEQLILPFSHTGAGVEVLVEALDWLPGVQHDLKSMAGIRREARA